MVAYWTHTHVIMGLNLSKVNIFFIQPPCCYFTLYKAFLHQSFVFSTTSVTIHHCMSLLQVALVAKPPH